MTELKKAREEYKQAGQALDFYTVVGGNEEGYKKAFARYEKAVEELKKVDENFRKMYE